jgi:hypothetical protein
MTSCDHPKLEQAAFDRAVEQRRTTRGSQAELAGELEIRRQYEYPPSGELLLQTVAEFRIESVEIRGLTHSVSIGRVREKDSRFRWSGLLQRVASVQGDGRGAARCLEVGEDRLRGGRTAVCGMDQARSRRDDGLA